MSGRDAEAFETALQLTAQGQSAEPRLRPLVETAILVGVLAEAPPSPPAGLLAGRQRFLTEAARMRSHGAVRRFRFGWGGQAFRVASVIVALLLVFGMVLAGGRAAAEGLPGEPLYNLKLAWEQARLAVTRDPQGRAELQLALVEERLEEVVRLVGRGEAVGNLTADRVERQLAAALLGAVAAEDPAAVRYLQRLDAAIQLREQPLAAAEQGVPEAERAGLRQILTAMERVRQEAQEGQGDPDQLRRRLREGPQPTDQPGAGQPEQPSPVPERAAGQPTDTPEAGDPERPSPTPGTPTPTRPTRPTRGPEHGPQPTHTQPLPETEEADGPQATERPGNGATAGPRPTDGTRQPEANEQPDHGDRPTEAPEGSGPGPQPTGEPGQPDGTEEPGSGPRPTDSPAGHTPGPEPTGEGDDPGAPGEPGHGSDPTDQPGHGPEPTGEAGEGSRATDEVQRF